MLVYICRGLNETQVNDSGPCEGGVGDTVAACRNGELIAAWAVGAVVSNAVVLEFLTYCIPLQSTFPFMQLALLHQLGFVQV